MGHIRDILSRTLKMVDLRGNIVAVVNCSLRYSKLAFGFIKDYDYAVFWRFKLGDELMYLKFFSRETNLEDEFNININLIYPVKIENFKTMFKPFVE